MNLLPPARKKAATCTTCAALLLTAVALNGCGTTASFDFPNRLEGAQGQVFFLEDIEQISNNENMTEEQKRQAIRDLGIEDEKLIDALLTL